MSLSIFLTPIHAHLPQESDLEDPTRLFWIATGARSFWTPFTAISYKKSAAYSTYEAWYISEPFIKIIGNGGLDGFNRHIWYKVRAQSSSGTFALSWFWPLLKHRKKKGRNPSFVARTVTKSSMLQPLPVVGHQSIDPSIHHPNQPIQCKMLRIFIVSTIETIIFHSRSFCWQGFEIYKIKKTTDSGCWCGMEEVNICTATNQLLRYIPRDQYLHSNQPTVMSWTKLSSGM